MMPPFQPFPLASVAQVAMSSGAMYLGLAIYLSLSQVRSPVSSFLRGKRLAQNNLFQRHPGDLIDF